MIRRMVFITVIAILVVSHNLNASVIISPDSVIAAPPTLITGYSYDRTIDQSGLSVNFVSGITDFDTYIALNPTHEGLHVPQTLAASSRNPSPHLNVDYDLGSTFIVEQLAFWNYPWPDSLAITGFNIYTSSTQDFLTSVFAGSFNPISDGNRITRINEAQVFDLVDSSARYVRFQITDVENYSGNGFSEIAFDVTAVPIPATIWLFITGLIGLYRISNKSNT